MNAFQKFPVIENIIPILIAFAFVFCLIPYFKKVGFLGIVLENFSAHKSKFFSYLGFGLFVFSILCFLPFWNTAEIQSENVLNPPNKAKKEIENQITPTSISDMNLGDKDLDETSNSKETPDSRLIDNLDGLSSIEVKLYWESGGDTTLYGLKINRTLSINIPSPYNTQKVNCKLLWKCENEELRRVSGVFDQILLTKEFLTTHIICKE